MLSKLNTSAPGNAIASSNAGPTHARNSATKALAAPAEKPSSQTCLATADAQYCSHHFLAARSHLLAGSHAIDPNRVAIHRFSTTATPTKRNVRNARTWWRRDACVGKRRSKISHAGATMSVVATYAATNCGADLTSAARAATGPVIAKTQMDSRAPSLAESSRRYAIIRTWKTLAMRLFRARKISHAKAKYSLRAHVRHKSRR